MKKCYFSLIEIMVVMAIIMLIAGVTITRLGKVPSWASLEKVGIELESFFAHASRVATMQGKTVKVFYNPTEHIFLLQHHKEHDKWSNKTYLTNQFYQYKIPEHIKSKLKDSSIFICHPNGAITGSEIHLQSGEHRLIWHFSPLTGRMQRYQEEKEQ